jgi:hypothetical protein
MFVFTVNHNGRDFWLRGTVWSFSRDRATEYATEWEASEALEKAKPFMAAKVYRAAKLERA